MKKTGFLSKAMAAAFMVLVLLSVTGATAYAQGTAPPKSEAVLIAEAGRPVWHYTGAAIGLGMIVIGAGIGIGRFAAAAAEAIGRQPAAAAQITGAVSLPLFLLEGVAVIGEVVVLLIVFK
jgi:F-type H+-transporting ATPase subunit c